MMSIQEADYSTKQKHSANPKRFLRPLTENIAKVAAAQQVKSIHTRSAAHD
jgi:hypothetical protein